MENLEKSRRKLPKPRPISRRRHNFIYLLLGILFAILTIYILFTFPPSSKLAVGNIGIPIIPIFLVSLTGFIFCTFTFIFIQKTQGILIGIFVILYLILRMIGLTHWIFLVLVLGLFTAVEFFIFKKK
jgi:hypothetical protein